MITEDYCSFEIAKLLKEKGFDEPVQHFYKFDSKELYRGTVFTNTQIGDKFYNAPTHQMAMKWLREEHKISIDICVVQGRAVSYMFNIWDFSVIQDNKFIGGTFDLREQLFNFLTYEEAVEAALKYCLENLI